ncbi:single-stranded-DNA-specific exonuclease RecJ [Aurantimonas sp. MSK8Z-1]|uniref:single-stranded-DNA-specific exonuclease RecJ n=1 Tax=Mangrovibrevibacter kandeliae TaxID=2968473 RepID=UPI0021182DDA|nr:single-stranded-DNA-specific exonuclease RecJ [Aurantimonas sp. MSK8Z-1]MCW4114463.1 single-stranded-DNA-specific exonuclease RecJ [Aurantimonas sp. MSK8Z-1]
MAGTERVFLGVERSVGGRRWVHGLDAQAEAAALRIAQLHGLPELLGRVLAGRGVAADAAPAFLDPTIRALMPDPSSLTDMDRAARRLADAVDRRERVAIFGDYDVDGAASAALLWRYLSHLGLAPQIRIPDRIVEGYGPNPDAMRALAAEASLIVTVDCGVSSHEAIAAASVAGADVVVLDHHQAGTTLPAAVAVVDPNRQDDLSGQGHLAAAGVVFVTLAAVSRELRRRGRAPGDLPDLFAWLDLVALATVCDVVPLIGFNRALVVKGLQVLRQQQNAGLRALARIARISGPLDSYHLGFLIGPRINAGGRIGEAHLGSRLLTIAEASEADALAEQLHVLNAERQAMEREMLADADAEATAEIGGGEGPPVLVIAREGWHPGIVGLIAARLKERHRRPAFAIAFDASGRGTGSGRSVGGYDLGRLVRRAVEAGILVKGGGHAMAAGITIERDRLGDFRAFVEAEAAREVRVLMAGEALRFDGAVSAGGLTLAFAETLERAGPFGSGHPQPLFALPRHRIQSAAPVGGGHVRAVLKAADGSTAAAMAFRAEDTELGRLLLGGRDRPVHVAGTVSIDHFRGQPSARLRIVDAAESID